MNIPGIGPGIIKSILSNPPLDKAQQEFEYTKRQGIEIFFFTDQRYPRRLKHYEDSPALLYFKGKANLNADKVVAIVGTRQPTSQGQILCEQLIDGLKLDKLLLISGLAYGVDAIVHKRAVNNNIPNIGILGHGLSRVYPAVHKSLAKQMLLNGGLLTEYISAAGPEREHFPMRNRIIAGLCDALIVVESGQKGGSIISANLANSYNKDVFAFPGRVTDPKSEGCNQLIKQHQAAMIENVEDLLKQMNWDLEPGQSAQAQLFEELNDQEKQLVELFRECETLHIDYLSYQTHKSCSKISSILLEMEFKGLVKSLPGNRYRLIR